MKKLWIIGLTMAGLVACNNAEKENNEPQQETATEEVVQVDANRVLSMEIDGMVCKMGCGGSIRKELKSTGAVAECEFDFEEERETNIAKISYDQNKISEEKLIELVQNLNDGQFKVGKTTAEDLEAKVNETESSDSNDEASIEINVEENVGGVPNLLELLSGLLLG